MRKEKQYMWVNPDDCMAPHGLDMSSEYHYNKVEWLRKQFVEDGFSLNESALVGYPLDGKIQLLSGTHRHRAAKLAGIDLPVTMWLRSDIERLWGTPEWMEVTEDISVNDLEEFLIKDGSRVLSYRRLDPNNLYDEDLKI